MPSNAWFPLVTALSPLPSFHFISCSVVFGAGSPRQPGWRLHDGLISSKAEQGARHGGVLTWAVWLRLSELLPRATQCALLFCRRQWVSGCLSLPTALRAFQISFSPLPHLSFPPPPPPPPPPRVLSSSSSTHSLSLSL